MVVTYGHSREIRQLERCKLEHCVGPGGAVLTGRGAGTNFYRPAPSLALVWGHSVMVGEHFKCPTKVGGHRHLLKSKSERLDTSPLPPLPSHRIAATAQKRHGT